MCKKMKMQFSVRGRGGGGGGDTTLPHPLLKNPGYATAHKSLFDLKSEKHWPKDKFHLAK